MPFHPLKDWPLGRAAVACRLVGLPTRLVGCDLWRCAVSIEPRSGQDDGPNGVVADSGARHRGSSGIVPGVVSHSCGHNCFGHILRILDHGPRLRVALRLECPHFLLHSDHVYQNPVDRTIAGFRTNDAVRQRRCLGTA